MLAERVARLDKAIASLEGDLLSSAVHRIQEKIRLFPNECTASLLSHQHHHPIWRIVASIEYNIKRRIQPAIARSRNVMEALKSFFDTHIQVRASNDVITQIQAQGTLNGVDVEALADTGSSANLISTSFAKRHNISFDKADRSQLQLPSGSKLRTLGSVTVNWRFSIDDEGPPRSYTFLVVKGIKSDVIIGDSLLSTTSTLTKYAHRLRRVRLRTVDRLWHLNLISNTNHSQRRMLGTLDGVETSAIPDTGADTPFLSKAYAISRGFAIDTNPGSRTTIEYADGSRETTDGIVRHLEWKFGDTVRYLDFQVLENPTFDVLLHVDLLLETNAFSEWEKILAQTTITESICHGLDSVYNEFEDMFSNLFHITNIGILDKARDWLKKHIIKDEIEDTSSPMQSQSSARLAELQRRAYFDTMISTIAEPAQSAARATESQRRLAWDRHYLAAIITPTSASNGVSI